jgi:hypothetical protein
MFEHDRTADPHARRFRIGHDGRTIRATTSAAQEEATMARMIRCECGFQALGANDEEVLASITAHIEVVHPDRVGLWTSSDLLSMAVSIDD